MISEHEGEGLMKVILPGPGRLVSGALLPPATAFARFASGHDGYLATFQGTGTFSRGRALSWLARGGRGMIGAPFKAGMAAVIIAATIGVSSPKTAQAQDPRCDEETIRKVIAEMTDGFNRHDAVAYTRRGFRQR
jgi:hypothetical protein